jgi:hypothetical protein
VVLPVMERPILGNWKTGERTVLPHHTEEQKQDAKVTHTHTHLSCALALLTWGV